ncbi:hypothetical protein GCM10009662_83130 [Catellatospora coxensis]|uniref:Uncharacterized protein n=1 Tax=Catellatospora coxensis TaxID=310354 RepID=A0A8J3PCE8_9ACTN|nr:hypothetical protein Cco03nite_79980 [Catellatospora coxensis]
MAPARTAAVPASSASAANSITRTAWSPTSRTGCIGSETRPSANTTVTAAQNRAGRGASVAGPGPYQRRSRRVRPMWTSSAVATANPARLEPMDSSSHHGMPGHAGRCSDGRRTRPPSTVGWVSASQPMWQAAPMSAEVAVTDQWCRARPSNP